MRTRTREVKTYVEEWLCEQDGCDGLMEQTGRPFLMCDPPKIIHICDTCRHEEHSVETYPKAKVEYVDKE